MRIDRRLVLIGVMLVVLSMTMATQYATTKIGYTYAIVHPSESDIRFIGSDNSSDGLRILRGEGLTNDTDNKILTLRFGNITANINSTYTAAFGIVNEEPFKVNITHINVSLDGGDETDYMQIWLHGNPYQRAGTGTGEDSSAVLVWNKESVGFDISNCAWQLGAGDMDPYTLNASNVSTPWDVTAHVRYCQNFSKVIATNQTSDFVWVQVSFYPPADAETTDTYAGTIYVHTKATTHLT